MSDVLEIIGLPHTRIREDESACEAWFERKDGPLVKLSLSPQAVSVAATKLMDAHLRLTSQSASTNALVQTRGLSVGLAAAQPVPASDQVLLQFVMGGTGTTALFLLDQSTAIQLAKQIVEAAQSQQPDDDTTRH